jgi:N-methylhydantoinase B
LPSACSSPTSDATEVYQEGLRLPLVKIVERGEYNRDVWKIILSNHRTPDTTWGDYHAMIGSLTIAERRLHEVLTKYARRDVCYHGAG